jgi:hypothetical protein
VFVARRVVTDPLSIAEPHRLCSPVRPPGHTLRDLQSPAADLRRGQGEAGNTLAGDSGHLE